MEQSIPDTWFLSIKPKYVGGCNLRGTKLQTNNRKLTLLLSYKNNSYKNNSYKPFLCSQHYQGLISSLEFVPLPRALI